MNIVVLCLPFLLLLSGAVALSAGGNTLDDWIGTWEPVGASCPSSGCCCATTPIFISASPAGTPSSTPLQLATTVNGTSCTSPGSGYTIFCSLGTGTSANTLTCSQAIVVNFGFTSCTMTNPSTLQCAIYAGSGCPSSGTFQKLPALPALTVTGSSDWDGKWTGVPACPDGCCCWSNPVAISGNAPASGDGSDGSGPPSAKLTLQTYLVTNNSTASANACFGLPLYIVDCNVDLGTASCTLPFQTFPALMTLNSGKGTISVQEAGFNICPGFASFTLSGRETPGGGGLSAGGIAGIVIAVLIVACAGCCGAFFFLSRSAFKSGTKNSVGQQNLGQDSTAGAPNTDYQQM